MIFEKIIENVYNVDEILFYLNYKWFHTTKIKWWTHVKYYSDQQKMDLTFCYDILGDVSRSFAEVINNLPQRLSMEIMVFYLMCRALDTVEDDITAFDGDKTKRAEYLKTFYMHFNTLSNVGETKYRPLLQNYDRIETIFKLINKQTQSIILDIVKRMGEGMATFVLSDYVINEISSYNEYCNIVAGLVGEGLVKIFINSEYEMETFGNIIFDEKKTSSTHGFGGLDKSMGLFLQKTNIIRDYFEDINSNKQWWPKEIWYKYKRNFKDMKHDILSKNCINEMVLDALKLIPDIFNFHENITDVSIFKFCAIPQIMAIATLDKCFDNPKIFTEYVKIRKGLALKIMQTVKTMDDMYAWFYRFIINIKNKIRHNDPNKNELIDVCDKILIIIHKKYSPPLITTNMQIIITICILLAIAVIVGIASIQWIYRMFTKYLLHYYVIYHNTKLHRSHR